MLALGIQMNEWIKLDTKSGPVNVLVKPHRIRKGVFVIVFDAPKDVSINRTGSSSLDNNNERNVIRYDLDNT